MQIVIEIDEDIYKDWKREGKYASRSYAQRIILDGKPLPEGHGRLIDADRLKIDNPLHLSLDIPYVTEDTVEDIIDYAPTIIDSYKEG